MLDADKLLVLFLGAMGLTIAILCLALQCQNKVSRAAQIPLLLKGASLLVWAGIYLLHRLLEIPIPETMQQFSRALLIIAWIADALLMGVLTLPDIFLLPSRLVDRLKGHKK